MPRTTSDDRPSRCASKCPTSQCPRVTAGIRGSVPSARSTLRARPSPGDDRPTFVTTTRSASAGDAPPRCAIQVPASSPKKRALMSSSPVQPTVFSKVR